jgi:hypothetical protein
MNRKLIFTLIAIALYGSVYGQTLKFRTGANYGKFNKEIGGDEIEYPSIDIYNQDKTDFTHAFEPGFEAEIMQLWSPNIETGIEFDFSKFSGKNDTPPVYNYFFLLNADDFIFPVPSLIYESSALNLMLNFRYYFLPEGKVSPFLKVFGGVSFVGTDFNYKDQGVWPQEGAGILFSMGTENSDNSRESSLCYGTGLGFDFELNDRISLYVDGSASIIGSDKVDGIPTLDYIVDNGRGTLLSVDNKALTTQISFGIVFTSDVDLGLSKNSGKNKKGKGLKRSGQTTPWRPFYRQK